MELKSLNNKQIEAVRATEGRVRIIAGTGSGKTRVLAYRYAYLVEELGIDPGNILCLTFTRTHPSGIKFLTSAAKWTPNAYLRASLAKQPAWQKATAFTIKSSATAPSNESTTTANTAK